MPPPPASQALQPEDKAPPPFEARTSLKLFDKEPPSTPKISPISLGEGNRDSHKIRQEKLTRDNSEPDAKFSQRSAIGSLSGPAIRRQLISDAIQHPTTLLPLAASTISVIYLALLSSVLGGAPWAVASLAVSGSVAIASFVRRYLSRHTEEYARRLEQGEVRRLRKVLEVGFSKINSAEGMKALRGLVGEHELLKPALVRRDGIALLSTSLIPSLSEETYRRGLSVLSDGLELMNAARSPGRERLKEEIAELEREVEALRGDKSQAERLRIKEGTLASQRERLEMIDGLGLRVDQLLYQAHRCEASLHRARIELAAIGAGSTETSVDSVIEALKSTIHQAKKVQEDLKRLGC
jgi:hypothetical protein